jgi:UrcA family protein
MLHNKLLPLAALLLFAGAAQAEAVPAALVVNHADLDLTKDVDATTMLDRVAHAAIEPCAKFDSIAARRCAIQVIAKAVVALNQPLVSKVYTQRYGIAPEKLVTP